MSPEQTSRYPEPPAYFQPEGKARWKQMYDIMTSRHSWSNNWIPALEQLCLNYQHLAAIDDSIAKAEQSDQGFPLLVPMGAKGGGWKTNPILEYRLKVVHAIRRALHDFHLVPRFASDGDDDADVVRKGNKDNFIPTKPNLAPVWDDEENAA